METYKIICIIILVLIIAAALYLSLHYEKNNVTAKYRYSQIGLGVDVRVSSQTFPISRQVLPRVEAKNKQDIPMVIIQSNELDTVPQGILVARDEILAINPDYRYKYYSEVQRLKFVTKYFDQRTIDAYQSLVPGAYRCDFFRICYLYKKGGVYMDVGFTCVKPLREVFDDNYSMVLPEDNGRGNETRVEIHNAFMASIKNHPFFGLVIEEMVKSIENKDYSNGALGITGPSMIGRVYYKVYGIIKERKIDDILVKGKQIKLVQSFYHPERDTAVISEYINYDDVLANPIFYTKNPVYRMEQSFYNKPHYSKYFDQRAVFGEKELEFNKPKVKDVISHITVHPPAAEYCTVPNLKYVEGLNPKYAQQIPRIIVQTNSRDDIPINMKKSMDYIRYLNPEYDYYYFSDQDVEKFLVENYPPRVIQCYKKLIPGAFKADLFRVCFLLKKGGVYVDSAFCEVTALRDFINPEDQFIIPEDDNISSVFENSFLHNAFMASIPNHPYLQAALEQILTNIETRFIDPKSALGITGPLAMGRVFDKMVGHKAAPFQTYKLKDHPYTMRIIQHLKNLPDDKYHEYASKMTDGKEYAGIPNRVLFRTRYMRYSDDRKIYHQNNHYGLNYEKKLIYHP